ncbi:sigma-70 family RNA polymerase sigma factor [candidate division KSB1 bacterium]|nr:sigma-70 family RNA polymerase sigma factor [candidate division KSB1 bacterium]
MSDTDKRLVQKAKAGDKHAFGKLVNKYQKWILNLVYELVHDWEEAKDLAQEAFIRSYEKLAQFQERSEFSTWLYRIAINLVTDFHRRQKKYIHEELNEKSITEDSLDINQNSAQAALEDPVERIELRQKLDRAIQLLSEQQRIVTVLRYFHQKSLPEIAEIMECSESTARVHLFRAMTNLKKLLGNYMVENV